MDLRKKPRPPRSSAAGTTLLAESAWAVTPLCVVCGAGLGGLLTLLADWLVTVPWAPFKGPAELVNSIPEPGRTLGAVAAGVLGGLLLGFLALHESLSRRISGSHVVLITRDTPQEFARAEVVLAFRDRKQLVLLGPDSLEIAREDCTLPWRRVAEAFTGHGYRWADEDPHRDDFRRWVPGMPGLPDGADALLRAHAAARAGHDGTEDARELRGELLRLGVVVRDDNDRQYWRMPRQP